MSKLADTTQYDGDAMLVARVKFGDREAFEELMSRHTRRVHRAVVSILGDFGEAEDSVQDTFLKAFQHIGEFQQRAKFSTWLLSIASNTALQRIRDTRRLQRLSEEDDGSGNFSCQLRSGDPDPEQRCAAAERRRLLDTGLKKIPAKYRAVLVLRDIEQLSTEEAARILGLGIPALKARLFRGRLMLREILSRHLHRGKRTLP